MSQVKLSTWASIAVVIATAFGSMVALAQIAPATPPKVVVPTTPAQLPVTQYPPITGIITPPVRVQPPLRGFVDLHTHPLSYLGFGGKLIYGGVDVGSWLPPENPPLTFSCFQPGPPTAPPPVTWTAPNGTKYVLGVANSESDALGHEYEVHGPGPPAVGDNWCGDLLRNAGIIGLQTALASGVQLPPQAVAWWTSPFGTPFSVDGISLPAWYPTLEKTAGPPNFPTWPTWFDEVNQRMWVDWIRRAWQGGLRVMVALAVNSKLLGNLASGPGDLPTDDKASADLQIAQTIAFVGRHSDGTGDNFMKIAYSSNDVYNIVSSGRLAVVIGVEIDTIGDLVGNYPACNPAAATAQCPLVAEVDRLYNEGVRYIFPVHLVDNPIGGAAAYSDLFDIASVYENSVPGYLGFDLGCSAPGDNITYLYTLPNDINTNLQGAQTQLANFVGSGLANTAVQYFMQSVLPSLEQQKLGKAVAIPPAVLCPQGLGNINKRGLTPAGIQAIQEMMNRQMLIDIDHMSQATLIGTPGGPGVLTLAQQHKPYPYPLNSGHNALRVASERNLTPQQYAAIGSLHGMAGVGSATATADQWLWRYTQVTNAMAPGLASFDTGIAGFGTDFDGMEFGMPPRGTSYGPGQCPPSVVQQLVQQLPPAEQQFAAAAIAAAACFVPSSNVQAGTPAFPLPPARDGSKIWNYNTDGVAHYGMLPDYLADVASLPGVAVTNPISGAVVAGPSGSDVVNKGMMNGAQYFYATWRLAEGNPLPACPAPQQPDATGLCTCPAATTYNGHGGCACPNATQVYLPSSTSAIWGSGACGCASGVPDQNGNCVASLGGATGSPVTNVCPAACKYGCNAITKACNAQPPQQIQLIPH